MSFLENLTAFLPIGKKEEKLEYFFAIDIGVEKLTAALWTIEGKELKILSTDQQKYTSLDEIITTTDRLLDQVLGLKEIEPQKILFGVPHSWLSDDNLKDEYLKILRTLVKELGLSPMAYVATSHALIHLLEKQEGVPATAILVGFDSAHLTVTVVRAGKIDGVKVLSRGESSGADADADCNSPAARIIEKALITFTDVETLPSKILIYGDGVKDLKDQLLSFSWMSKLSFLHFPKIEILGDGIAINSICLAGASEINTDVVYKETLSLRDKHSLSLRDKHSLSLRDKETLSLRDKETLSLRDKETLSRSNRDKETLRSNDLKETLPQDEKDQMIKSNPEKQDVSEKQDADDGGTETPQNFGFMVGDVAKTDQRYESEAQEVVSGIEDYETGIAAREENLPEIDDFEKEAMPVPQSETSHKKQFNIKRMIPKNFTSLSIIFGVIGVIVLLAGVYLFMLKADVRVFVEPKVLEKDTQVLADPNQKVINEEEKIIPGQIVEVEVSDLAKDTASGKKQIGDPAKGTIIVYNKTFESKSLSKGTQISGGGNLKFTLDTSVTIASQSASDSGITFGKSTTTVTATSIGADGNLPSGSEFSVAGNSQDKLAAKSEGNFSGGTSKEVTVVSSEDTQRLLAKLSSDLRRSAQQKLQEKYPNKKILEEALSENIVKKSYSKNVNDQASEFSLTLTTKYKGTAFDDADLKTIVSKLVTTQVPEGFQLDLSETETQADVSELKKDGKLIFLARFKAKLMPKVDRDRVKKEIQLKTPEQAIEILKRMDNVLGAQITMTPGLPGILSRLPFLSKNITVEVGLK